MYNLGVSPSLVSRYCESYSFWSIWGPKFWNFGRLRTKLKLSWLCLVSWPSQYLDTSLEVQEILYPLMYLCRRFIIFVFFSHQLVYSNSTFIRQTRVHARLWHTRFESTNRDFSILMRSYFYIQKWKLAIWIHSSYITALNWTGITPPRTPRISGLKTHFLIPTFLSEKWWWKVV